MRLAQRNCFSLRPRFGFAAHLATMCGRPSARVVPVQARRVGTVELTGEPVTPGDDLLGSLTNRVASEVLMRINTETALPRQPQGRAGDPPPALETGSATDPPMAAVAGDPGAADGDAGRARPKARWREGKPMRSQRKPADLERPHVEAPLSSAASVRAEVVRITTPGLAPDPPDRAHDADLEVPPGTVDARVALRVAPEVGDDPIVVEQRVADVSDG